MSQLRQQELDEVEKVKEAYIESDGRINVVQREQKSHAQVERKKK
jgi:uncharacterized membrane protein YcaP (DUF421 family)